MPVLLITKIVNSINDRLYSLNMNKIIKTTISLCILINFASHAQAPTDIIERFIEVSGGLNLWEDIDFLQFQSTQTNIQDSVVKDDFVGFFRSKPACYVLRSKQVTYNSDENSRHHKREGEGWISMDIMAKHLGMPIRIRYNKICPALDFTINHNLIDYFYTISNKDFGNDYYVLEKKIEEPTKVVVPEERKKKNYLLFSKKDSLLKFDITTMNGKEIRVLEFLEYKMFDGYLFPILQKLTPEKISYLGQLNNKEEGILQNANRFLQPKIIAYENIKFNQPIDESVFEMD